MGARPSGLLGVVEIGGDPTLLIVGAVFIGTFIAVAAVGYLLLRKARTDRTTPTWQFQLQTRLPVSKPTFDRISRATQAGLSTPATSPATRAQFDQLDRARSVCVSVYRVVMILVGLAGVTGGILLIRSHTPGNMQGLPGAIIVLVSLGALLNGLIPPRSIRPITPLDPALLDEAKQKIRIQVSHAAPLHVTLSESDLQRAAESLRRGLPVADVARAVYPSYDNLDDMDRRALESLIRQAVG
jgi:hypothetical protein